MKKSFVFRARSLSFCLALGVALSLIPTSETLAADDAASYYKTRPLFNPYPGGGRRFRDWQVQNFGPVGIGITLKQPIFTMVINNVEKGSPADATGKLKKGQVIESINGQVLEDRDPRMILGDIITEAEARDGVIKLQIRDLGEVVVKIPVMGAYSETWPLNCPKSDRIVRKLADLLASREKPPWGSALFMLSTGEDQDLDVVRKWLSGKERIGPYPWHAGYLGIAYCEYYLRTGDESVLPAIKEMGEELKRTMYNGGWSGRGHGSNFTYSTGTGQMHAAGVHCITFLMLAKMCGVELDDYMFQESLKTFYRFAGHENVPYGDGWPEGGFRDNGKSGGLAVAMAAAARLTPEGEDSVYAQARDNGAMKSFYATSWFHSAHTGGGIGEIWHNAAMSMMHKRRPVQYRSFLDTRRWVMELSRRHDGGIGIAGVKDRYDRSASEHDRAWGNYFALTYTLPREKLMTFGAPKTEWCQSHTLPERPWGRPADDAFVRTTPAEHPAISMQDLLKEKVPTDASLAVGGRLGSPDVTDETLWKYLHHPEIGYRTAAMRTIVRRGRSDFVLPLLNADDPRLRHAGLLAFTGMFKGRSLPGDALTPEMFERVGRMIEDPNEALWVVQAALKAMGRTKPSVVATHRETILDYMKHDDWFLRVSAINAVEPICALPGHYKTVMPPVFKTLAAFTTAQALSPVWSLKKSLARAKPAIKVFAFEALADAYASVPPKMRFPGGRVIPNGAKTVRSQLGQLMGVVPGGTDFVETRPKMTTKAARTGKESDMYRYSGTFEPNPKLVGTWHWAVWPRPKTAAEVAARATAWAKARSKPNARKERPKKVLQLMDDGRVKSDAFRGYFWSGDMLVGTDVGIARKMARRKIAGREFLVIETGGFDPDAEAPKTWDRQYTIYMKVE